MADRNFILRMAGKQVGRIVDVSVDWPWHKGEFLPHPLFADYAGIFAECLAASDSIERERLMAVIFSQGLELVAEESGLLFKSTPGSFKRGEIVRIFLERGSARFRFG